MFIVSIEERYESDYGGLAYRTVATDNQAEVQQLEQAGAEANFAVIVRHADTVQTTLDWIRKNAIGNPK